MGLLMSGFGRGRGYGNPGFGGYARPAPQRMGNEHLPPPPEYQFGLLGDYSGPNSWARLSADVEAMLRAGRAYDMVCLPVWMLPHLYDLCVENINRRERARAQGQGQRQGQPQAPHVPPPRGGPPPPPARQQVLPPPPPLPPAQPAGGGLSGDPVIHRMLAEVLAHVSRRDPQQQQTEQSAQQKGKRQQKGSRATRARESAPAGGGAEEGNGGGNDTEPASDTALAGETAEEGDEPSDTVVQPTYAAAAVTPSGPAAGTRKQTRVAPAPAAGPAPAQASAEGASPVSVEWGTVRLPPGVAAAVEKVAAASPVPKAEAGDALITALHGELTRVLGKADLFGAAWISIAPKNERPHFKTSDEKHAALMELASRLCHKYMK